MEQHVERAVERVVRDIRGKLGEPITVDDMARTAMFSKFHFTRLFQRVTGVSPGRFLSAVRIEEAKRLLLTTSLSVIEISNLVGYNSVGTFSSRFKSSVGLSPTAYRRMGGYVPQICLDNRRRGSRAVTVCGEITSPPSRDSGLIFIGLFPEPIPQGAPVRCTILREPGSFEFHEVPSGSWYVLAQSVASGHEELADDPTPYVSAHGPIVVRPEIGTTPMQMQLREMRDLDPPVLLALLDARRVALSAVVA